VDEVLQGFEGVDYSQLLGTLDESVLIGTSDAEYYDTSAYFPLSLLTAQVHEPQPYFLSGLSQSAVETFAESSYLQLSPNPSSHGVQQRQQQPSPTPSSHTLNFNKVDDTRMETYPSPTSLPSPDQVPSQSPTPSVNGRVPVEAPEGKRAISSERANLVCKTCTMSFPNALRFKNHVNRRSCRAPSECHQCGEPIKHPKDLKRHLGSSQAAPACPALKGPGKLAKRFACTSCSKVYLRKDSLQRHVQEKHRCQACNKSYCACS
jgi:hypothetical protein